MSDRTVDKVRETEKLPRLGMFPTRMTATWVQ